LTVEVRDDAIGTGSPDRRGGLHNLLRRAEHGGGTFERRTFGTSFRVPPRPTPHMGANPTDHTTLDAAALPTVIDRTKAQGYQFVTLQSLTG